MPTVTVNDVALYYELSGPADAPVVVFINGIFQDTSGWALAQRALENRYRVLVYDCRGQGRSDKPVDGPYWTEQHAHDLAALLDNLAITQAHLVGLSNGGMILMWFARLYAARARSLAFVDTFAYLDAVQQAMMRSWRAALEAGGSALRFMISLPWTWGAAFLEANLDAVLALREKAALLPTHSSVHLIDGVINHDARSWLRAIDIPTIIVHGDQDRMAPPHSVHTLHEHLPHARLHWIADAGHAAWLEKPDEFAAVIAGWLDSH